MLESCLFDTSSLDAVLLAVPLVADRLVFCHAVQVIGMKLPRYRLL